MQNSDNQSNNSQDNNSHQEINENNNNNENNSYLPSENETENTASEDIYENDVGGDNIEEITEKLNNQDPYLKNLVLSKNLSEVSDAHKVTFQQALKNSTIITEIQIFPERDHHSQDISNNLAIIRDYLPTNLSMLEIQNYTPDLFESLNNCPKLQSLTIDNLEELGHNDLKSLEQLQQNKSGLEITDGVQDLRDIVQQRNNSHQEINESNYNSENNSYSESEMIMEEKSSSQQYRNDDNLLGKKTNPVGGEIIREKSSEENLSDSEQDMSQSESDNITDKHQEVEKNYISNKN